MALINFAVLLGLFFKFAAPGFKKMARDRHELVAKQLAESKTLRDAAAAKLAEYAHKVANLEQEIATLVSNFRSEGEAEKQRIISEAEARAARLHKDAEQQIQAEIARVRTALEREVTLTAIAAAEKILVERTTDADQRALAEAFVAKLGDQKSTPRA
jgi:F-type H+-transporting ATPase subunit b